MIHRMALKLSNALADRTNADERARQIYCYGIEVILSNVTTLLSVLLIGLLMDRIDCAVIYLIIYSSLKVTCGGFHARTQLVCWIISIMSFVATVLLTDATLSIPGGRALWIVILVLCTVYILLTPPVMNSNHPVSQKTVKKNKKISSFLILVYSISIVVLYFVTDWYFMLNFMVLTILSVVIGKIIAERKE